MESTAFALLVWPVILTTIEALAACWIVSTLARWTGRLVGALFFFVRRDEAEGPHGRRLTAGRSDRLRRDAVDPRAVASRGVIARVHRNRLAG